MESTGVYWVAAHEVFESHGLAVILANAPRSACRPGRKSDVNDASGCSAYMPVDCCVPVSVPAAILRSCVLTFARAKSTPIMPPRISNTCRKR